jgi:hypothetical protein
MNDTSSHTTTVIRPDHRQRPITEQRAASGMATTTMAIIA